MKAIVKGALVGGFIAFIWVNISWMILPWHQLTISSVPDEEATRTALRTQIPESGLYILPWSNDKSQQEATRNKVEEGPFAYMVVHPRGVEMNMSKMMILGLLSNIFIAAILSLLLNMTSGLGYIRRVGFVKTAAIAGSLVVVMPNLIWWHFPIGQAVVTIVDTGFTWGFAGMAIAKFVKD